MCRNFKVSFGRSTREVKQRGICLSTQQFVLNTRKTFIELTNSLGLQKTQVRPSSMRCAAALFLKTYKCFTHIFLSFLSHK